MSSPWKDFPDHTDPSTERRKYPPEVLPDVDHLLDRDPEVMPDFTLASGGPITVTMPLEGDYVLQADPWPPLSREQVVELHEALVDFRRTMESSKSLKGDDEQMALIWETATSLDGLLVSLHIGTPPQPRRWTDDDIRAALEKHERGFAEDKAAATMCHGFEPGLGGFACLDERWSKIPEGTPMQHGPTDPVAGYAQPPHLKPEHVEDWTAWARRGFPLGDPGKAVRFHWYRQLEEPTATLVTSPLGEVEIPEGLGGHHWMCPKGQERPSLGAACDCERLYQEPTEVQRRWLSEREVKHNCWTCRHKGDHCLAPGASMNSQILDWLYVGVPLKDRLFPPSVGWEKVEPCPGWESKP